MCGEMSSSPAPLLLPCTAWGAAHPRPVPWASVLPTPLPQYGNPCTGVVCCPAVLSALLVSFHIALCVSLKLTHTVEIISILSLRLCFSCVRVSVPELQLLTVCMIQVINISIIVKSILPFGTVCMDKPQATTKMYFLPFTMT